MNVKSLTCWKVYEYTTSDGVTNTVVVGLDTDKGIGIIEDVRTSGEGKINEYTLFGDHNHYFEGQQQLWMEYCAKHHVNSIKDVSDNY